MKVFIIIFMGFLLASCAGLRSNLSCEGTNWYELGRQEGRQGKVDGYSKQLRKSCGLNEVTVFGTGYQAGLAEYCSTENAFNTGRLGLSPANNCPEQYKESYSSALNEGRRYAEIEASTLKTNEKIESLTVELGDAGLSLAKRALREGQRLELLDDKDQKLTELKTLEESVEASQVNQ